MHSTTKSKPLFAVMRRLPAMLSSQPRVSRVNGPTQSRGGDEAQMPYEVAPSFMSEAEIALDELIRSCADELHLTLHRKVRMIDVLTIPPRCKEWSFWFGRISPERADFLVCAGTRPVAIIQLTDRSRRCGEPDAFLDAACRSAGLPVLCISDPRPTDPAQVVKFLQHTIRSVPSDELKGMRSRATQETRPQTYRHDDGRGLIR